jgi:hypothetical protein
MIFLRSFDHAVHFRLFDNGLIRQADEALRIIR